MLLLLLCEGFLFDQYSVLLGLVHTRSFGSLKSCKKIHKTKDSNSESLSGLFAQPYRAKCEPDVKYGLYIFIVDTSRPPKNGEIDGKDYYFISQNTFQSDINSHKFVKYGQFEGDYYGTSIDSIKAVTNNNKVCVLNLHCQVCQCELFECGIRNVTGNVLDVPKILLFKNSPIRILKSIIKCSLEPLFC